MRSAVRIAYITFISGFYLVLLAMPTTSKEFSKESYKYLENLDNIIQKMRQKDFFRSDDRSGEHNENKNSGFSTSSILLGYILGLQTSGNSAFGSKKSMCGVPDTISDPNAPGEYQTQSKWLSKRNEETGLYAMKYTFANRRTPENIKFSDYEKIVTLAMCSWELVSNVRFRYHGMRSKSADVVFSFEKGNHGDGYPFDGRGGVLGHAFYPEDGRVHLDITENWYIAKTETGQSRKKDLFTAVLHEIGHTIGLKHSKDQSSVMSNSYDFRGLFESFRMPRDDIAGAENLYGKRRDYNPADENHSACSRARAVHSIEISVSEKAPVKPTASLKSPGQICQDQERHAAFNCPKWKLDGLCDRKIFESTLKRRCPKTCGHCTETTSHEKLSNENVNALISGKSMQDSLTTYDNDEIAT